MTDSTTKKQVVIVGANYLGSRAAKTLRNVADVAVTVIDKRDFFENSLATPKVITDGLRVAKVTLRPHDKQFVDQTWIHGLAVGATDKAVLVKRHGSAEDAAAEEVPYDYLVIGTGASYPLFKNHDALTRFERQKELLDVHESLKKAKHVVVVGNGIVAVETAGEIKAQFPSARVTMVGSKSRPLEGAANEYMQNRAVQALEHVGVELKMGDRVEGDYQPGDSITTKNGVDLGPVDVVLKAIGGMKVNSEWMKGSVLESALTVEGLIKINNACQVEGLSNVFAGGDVATGPGGEELPARLANYAGEQGGFIAGAIKKLLKNPEAKLGKFSTPMICGFTIGPDQALVFNPNTGKWLPIGKLIKWLKGGPNGTWMSTSYFLIAQNGVYDGPYEEPTPPGAATADAAATDAASTTGAADAAAATDAASTTDAADAAAASDADATAASDDAAADTAVEPAAV